MSLTRLLSMFSGAQLSRDIVSPCVDCVPVAEVALNNTGEARDRALAQRQERRLVASRERTQLTTVHVGEQRADTIVILLGVLRNAIHTDGEGPDRLVAKIILEALHKVVRLGHPLENVNGRADDHGIVGRNRDHVSGRDAIDGKARRLEALRDGVGDLIRRPVL